LGRKHLCPSTGTSVIGKALDFSCTGKVTKTMKDYIYDIIDSLPDDMRGTASTPATNHLFEVNDLNGRKCSEIPLLYCQATISLQEGMA
jgi:hypothetical protein